MIPIVAASEQGRAQTDMSRGCRTTIRYEYKLVEWH